MRLFNCLVPVVVVLLIKDSSAKPGVLGGLIGRHVGLLDPLGIFKPKNSDSEANSNAHSLGGGLNIGPISISGGFSSSSASSSASANGGSASASAKADAQANGYGGYGGSNANAHASADASAQGYGGSSGIYGGNHRGNGANNDHYHLPNGQPGYGSYDGSQSSANANANANVNANVGGNGGGFPFGSFRPVPYGPKATGNANANPHANAAANAVGNGGINRIPGRYPGSGIEVIPIDTLPISSDPPHQPPFRPQGPGKEETVIPIIVIEESPAQYPPHYHRPSYPHGRPYYNKPKQQPVEIIIIEESAPSQGDTSRSGTFANHQVTIDYLELYTNR